MMTIGVVLLVLGLVALVAGWALHVPEEHKPTVSMAANAPVESPDMETEGLPLAKVKSLSADGAITRHYLSAPVVAVETGELPAELVRDLPKDEDGDLVHSTRGWLCGVVDLVHEPERFGFKPGQPVRYWSPLPSESKYNPNMKKMGLFELVS